ncbi:MAG: ATP-grasp domain-containing protein [Desulfobacterales bacterium]
MIISFHPLFPGDICRLAAGRDPGPEDEAWIRQAKAVILPQGCRERWYRLARRLCSHVFPNYDARFAYPGKIGQIRLFRSLGIPHPPSRLYPQLSILEAEGETGLERPPMPTPFVFKFDWGDEGRTVHRIGSLRDWDTVVSLARRYESTGQKGFLIQQLVPCGARSLRVVVIGTRRIAYWRVLDDPDAFAASVSSGAWIDFDVDTHRLDRALAAVDALCRPTGIDLAGLDMLFCAESDAAGAETPLFIEINYFFGRKGLGGSEGYYRLLTREIERWLDAIGCATPACREKD